MNVEEARRTARERLLPSQTAALDADLLLGHALGRSRAWVLAHPEAELAEAESRAFRSLVECRMRGEPVAYLRGFVEWHGLEIEVTPDVLVPRPETELVLEAAMERARDARAGVAADIGTGSGAIAIGLARAIPDLTVIGVDVSAEALRVAGRNVARYRLEERVTLLKGHLLLPIPNKPDIIVANLPYLSDEMMAELGHDVRREPRMALHGGPSGVELYHELLAQLRERGWLVPFVLEIDPRQTEEVKALVETMLPGWRSTIRRDYAGWERMVVGVPPESGQ